MTDPAETVAKFDALRKYLESTRRTLLLEASLAETAEAQNRLTWYCHALEDVVRMMGDALNGDK